MFKSSQIILKESWAMSSADEFNFENHKINCRCCLRGFEEEDIQIKVTGIVEKRFQELTQIEVENFFFELTRGIFCFSFS